MSFINKKVDETVLRAKLTDKGRELLSKGLLTYNYWSVGDSEIDYNQVYDLIDTEDRSGAMILAPKDQSNIIRYPINSFVGGDQYNTVNGAQSILKPVYGKESTKGFFNGSGTNILHDYINPTNTKKHFKGIIRFQVAALTGTSTLSFNTLSGNCELGDIVMLCCANPTQTTLASETEMPNVAPYLYFKVLGRTANTVRFDRNLPAMNSGSNFSYGYVIKGDDPVNTYYSEYEPTYWDYDNLSYEKNEGDVSGDVKIWNFNVVFKDDIIGLDGNTYKTKKDGSSKAYSGILNIDPTINKNIKVFGVAHYTNNSTLNIYGEFIKRGSLKMRIPNIMYHKSHPSGNASTMGVSLTSHNEGADEYDVLKDNVGNVVGRVYFKQQIIIFLDEELSVAMSYRSNRSWTLPKLNVNAVPSPSGSAGFVTTEKELYVSYYFANDTTLGFKNSLPCQAYSVLSNGVAGQDSAMISFPNNELPFLKIGFTSVGSMVANKVFLLAQLVDKGKKPNPLMWKVIDITTTFKTAVGNLTPVDIAGKTYTLHKSAYDGASFFRLNNIMDGLPLQTVGEGLYFGEGDVFMGNVTAQAGANIHKASFTFPMLFNQFRHSKNPTYDSDGGRPVYISEVGVYNENKELVIIGKTSKPLRKGDGDTILLQLDLDF